MSAISHRTAKVAQKVTKLFDKKMQTEIMAVINRVRENAVVAT